MGLFDKFKKKEVVEISKENNNVNINNNEQDNSRIISEEAMNLGTPEFRDTYQNHQGKMLFIMDLYQKHISKALKIM